MNESIEKKKYLLKCKLDGKEFVGYFMSDENPELADKFNFASTGFS